MGEKAMEAFSGLFLLLKKLRQVSVKVVREAVRQVTLFLQQWAPPLCPISD